MADSALHLEGVGSYASSVRPQCSCRPQSRTLSISRPKGGQFSCAWVRKYVTVQERFPSLLIRRQAGFSKPWITGQGQGKLWIYLFDEKPHRATASVGRRSQAHPLRTRRLGEPESGESPWLGSGVSGPGGWCILVARPCSRVYFPLPSWRCL